MVTKAGTAPQRGAVLLASRLGLCPWRRLDRCAAQRNAGGGGAAWPRWLTATGSTVAHAPLLSPGGRQGAATGERRPRPSLPGGDRLAARPGEQAPVRSPAKPAGCARGPRWPSRPGTAALRGTQCRAFRAGRGRVPRAGVPGVRPARRARNLVAGAGGVLLLLLCMAVDENHHPHQEHAVEHPEPDRAKLYPGRLVEGVGDPQVRAAHGEVE